LTAWSPRFAASRFSSGPTDGFLIRGAPSAKRVHNRCSETSGVDSVPSSQEDDSVLFLRTSGIADVPREGQLVAAVLRAAVFVDRVCCGSPVSLTSIPRHLHWQRGGLCFQLLKSLPRAAPHDQLDRDGGFLLFSGHVNVLSDAAPLNSTARADYRALCDEM
jgi:hypothetical protein